VILILPMGLVASIVGVILRGQDSNILTRVDSVELIALAARNATNDSAVWRAPSPLGGVQQPRHLPSLNSESTSRPGAKVPLSRYR
jgi:hypothetical protein